ncbi:adhesion G protein-coupled receptor F5 [Salarias fasciatus]|uniref:adhesion G protein-coupled receptor F5 n=1 Tax=Salarias fasciatus TaxID=181472 RepID=UPI0011768774|nr:adhesion G protein-coupled receptor F5-like [Salarias fasciatus]
MQNKDNRNRMWTVVLLYILGLEKCQAAEAVPQLTGNSTQMYYSTLRIDESVIGNSEILSFSVGDVDLDVSKPNNSTTCSTESAGKRCSCAPGHSWTEEVCQSHRCCGNGECILQMGSAPVCLPDTTVSITGSIKLKDQRNQECETHSSDLLREIKGVFSTLRGFDTWEISEPSPEGIVDFEMTLPLGVSPDDLTEKSQYLVYCLGGSLDLQTIGLVHSDMPNDTVCYDTAVTLNCRSQVNLPTQPLWYQRKRHGLISITTGTIFTVDVLGPAETSVTFRSLSAFVTGEYECVHQQTSNSFKISHISSGHVDVALLPDIDVFTEPQFPRCEKNSDVLRVKAICEIRNSTEDYIVTWQGGNIEEPSSFHLNGSEVYTAEQNVGCVQDSQTGSTELTCTFKNSCNQERSASVPINIIYEGEDYCEAEGEWPDTKAGFTANLKCHDMAGLRRRKCHLNATWGEAVSLCVNFELNSVLGNAVIIDSGLGEVKDNVAEVSFELKNLTNNTGRINSYANMNVSVQVLNILGGKLQTISNETTADNLLDSSSSLLDRSLEKSWTTRITEGNASLPETYLRTVEHLTDRVNITHVRKKPNLEVSACEPTAICESSVFNINISLKSLGKGKVKTIAFKQLEKYLPHSERRESEPNSAVVSVRTTKENNRQIKITIDFPLIHPRRQNFELTCVSWDFSSSQWSSRGCRWEGPSNEARCTCSHLSSFSILLSKYPAEVPLLSEITYVGLSVSVISLILALLIEAVIWKDVIKTNALYLRHIANINISLCLLVADCCFLASSKPRYITEMWCRTLTVLKHFFYLSMFFWMFSLSCALLHQTVFVFHTLSKKNYLLFSIFVGYACPLIIVLGSFVASKNGAKDVYFLAETCWLVYAGLMQGSFYTFVIPMGVILFANNLSIVIVILKLLSHHTGENSGGKKEKMAAKTIIRTVMILSPVLGVTWIFGFAVMSLDITSGTVTFVIHYVFVLLNSSQGFFLLLTTCFWDQMSREALMRRLKKTGTNGSFSSSNTNTKTTVNLNSINK